MTHDTIGCRFVHGQDLEQMLAGQERLVHWVVHRQWLGELGYEAAVQAGRLGLWRAVWGYDPGRGYAFSSYAVPAIERAVWRAVREAQRPVWEQLRAQPPQATEVPETCVEAQLVGEMVHRLVAQLPPRLRYIIVAHYGLAEEPAQSFAAIGQSLGVTRQRVQQLHEEALLWMAQPAHSLALRQLLDRNSVADYRAFLARQRRWLRRRRSR
jgi:RNA polymerase sigma factor (sigma-70 family)